VTNQGNLFTIVGGGGLFSIYCRIAVNSPTTGILEVNGTGKVEYPWWVNFLMIATMICSGGLMGVLYLIVYILLMMMFPDPSLPFVAALDDFEKQLAYLEKLSKK